MRKRVEDRLIRLAFEDEPLAGDSERITDLAKNAKEQERLHEYAQLRQDLRSAWEVPDHQLSNERLRHAILGQGLNNAKLETKSDFSWLWSSFATCGIVAALVFAFGKRATVHAPVVMTNAPVAMSAPLHFTSKPADSQTLVANRSTESFDSKFAKGSTDGYRVTELPAVSQKLSHVRHSRHKAAHVDNAYDSALQANNAFYGDSESDSNDDLARTAVLPISSQDSGKSARGISGAKPVGKPMSSPEAVVEIDQDKDDDTGARAAREIASKNVIVGG